MYKEGIFNIFCIYHLRFSCLQMKDAILFFSGQVILKGTMISSYLFRVAFSKNVYSQFEVFLNKQVHLGGHYLQD